VFGMPRSAIELGCVDKVAPIGVLAERIMQRIRAGSGSPAA
jgi:chemotaxis response regulator CheB